MIISGVIPDIHRIKATNINQANERFHHILLCRYMNCAINNVCVFTITPSNQVVNTNKHSVCT